MLSLRLEQGLTLPWRLFGIDFFSGFLAFLEAKKPIVFGKLLNIFFFVSGEVFLAFLADDEQAFWLFWLIHKTTFLAASQTSS